MSLRKWILLSVIFSMLVGCGGPWSSGDRVLVSKCNYDSGIAEPHRYDVVVFKYPIKPMEGNTPKNYIKRLLGLPGELIAIFFGRLYRMPAPDSDRPEDRYFDDTNVNENERYEHHYLHTDKEPARHWFEEGVDEKTGKERKFEILRKPPHVLLALRRIVYDNDYQAKDLKGKLDRWEPDNGSTWKVEQETGFVYTETKAAERVDWLRYQHLVCPPDQQRPIAGGVKVKPSLITDTMDYNSLQTRDSGNRTPAFPNWVGDLMLECNVEVVEAKGEFWFELSKGVNRFQARWDLASGECTLFRVGLDSKPEQLSVVATRVKSPGSYMLRFANIDARLTVWVDRDMPFEDGKAYDPPEMRGTNEKISKDLLEARRGPNEKNDLQPASIGGKGANVKLTHVRLWRDTYYTTRASGPDYNITEQRAPAEMWQDPKRWEPLRKQHATTMYVQPGHYLCLGDNSQASSDSRDWGLVPQRLMLGRALMVYFPLERVGPIR